MTRSLRFARELVEVTAGLLLRSVLWLLPLALALGALLVVGVLQDTEHCDTGPGALLALPLEIVVLVACNYLVAMTALLLPARRVGWLLRTVEVAAALLLVGILSVLYLAAKTPLCVHPVGAAVVSPQ